MDEIPVTQVTPVMPRGQGIDQLNEIFNLWFEIFFQGCLMSRVLGKVTDLNDLVKPEVLEACRSEALVTLQQKFPNVGIARKDQQPPVNQTERNLPVTDEYRGDGKAINA